MRLEDIKRISIREHLATLGILPCKHTSGGYMYLSPLRAETSPSFKVDEAKNCWFDHGIGKGGSIIDLVMQMDGCDFEEATKRLKTANLPLWSPPVSPCRQHPTLEITDVREIRYDALIRYIESRGISIELARLYCKQVHYRIDGRNYFAIGFENDAGGWELRNAQHKNGSSPKTITTIDTGSDEVLLFEGFFDFLAFLSLKNLSTPPADMVVLNSVTNLPKALPFLRRHRCIKLFLDNDNAGREAANKVREVHTAEIIDYAPNYAPCNDVNDYLISRLKR